MKKRNMANTITSEHILQCLNINKNTRYYFLLLFLEFVFIMKSARLMFDIDLGHVPHAKMKLIVSLYIHLILIKNTH